MAREISLTIWCDVCYDDNVQTEGEELPPITLGNLKPRVIALCEEHKAGLFDRLSDALTQHGVLADKLGFAGPQAAAAAPTRSKAHIKNNPEGLMFTCSACGPEVQYKVRSSANNHRDKTHGGSSEVFILSSMELPYKCDHCPETFSMPQGAAVHMEKRHPDAGGAPVAKRAAKKAAKELGAA